MYGCVFSTVGADVMVLKHQAISIYSADHTFIVWDQFHTHKLQLKGTTLENKVTFWKKYPIV